MMLKKLICLAFLLLKTHNFDLVYNGVPLSNCSISIESVCEKLTILQASKSAGLDKIHARILREAASQVALPLTTILSFLSQQVNYLIIAKMQTSFLYLKVDLEISHPTIGQSVLPLLL